MIVSIKILEMKYNKWMHFIVNKKTKFWIIKEELIFVSPSLIL